MTNCADYSRGSLSVHGLVTWRWRKQSAVQGVVAVPGLGCITVLCCGVVGILVFLEGALVGDWVAGRLVILVTTLVLLRTVLPVAS